MSEGIWDELGPYERRLLLDEAAGRSTGRASFEFNTVDVLLDFDAGKATLTDVLSGSQAEAAFPLARLLEWAESFGDDPSIGDGQTLAQRRPAASRVTPSGNVEPVPNER